MSKVIYSSTAPRFSIRHVNPWCILKDLLKYRELISSITIQNFRSTYRASYLGMAWQIILPLIMLAIFYFVIGIVLGGRFTQSAIESPLDYALALFVGLGFFNFVAQNMGAAPSLVISHQVYVKNLSFPLEIISITNVLNTLFTLAINLLLTALTLLIVKHSLPISALLTFYYVLSIFIITLGISWGLSALAVFIRDIAGIIPPITLMLMFMCPIFYPASMVPKKIKWIVDFNPIAVMIEDVRNCLLYGMFPSILSMLYVLGFSLIVAIIGYYFFMLSKKSFADVI